jgi:hypothetical protein
MNKKVIIGIIGSIAVLVGGYFIFKYAKKEYDKKYSKKIIFVKNTNVK